MSDTTAARSGVRTFDDPARAHELDRRHVFHSWSAQAALDPMVVTKAEGSHVWDGEGNRLLDFTSQLVFTNLGHQHPRIVAAIQEQAATLCTVAPAFGFPVAGSMSTTFRPFQCDPQKSSQRPSSSTSSAGSMAL